MEISNRLRQKPVHHKLGVLTWAKWLSITRTALNEPLSTFTGPLGLGLFFEQVSNGSISNVEVQEDPLYALYEYSALPDPESGETNGAEAIHIINCIDFPLKQIQLWTDIVPLLKAAQSTSLFVALQTMKKYMQCTRA